MTTAALRRTPEFAKLKPRNDTRQLVAYAEDLARSYLPSGVDRTGYQFMGVVSQRTMPGQLGRTTWNHNLREVGIYLNWPHLAFSEYADAVDTIRHEVAHLLAGWAENEDHGPGWQSWAVQLGATPEASANLFVPAKYGADCCGRQYRWSRHKPGASYSCPSCKEPVTTVYRYW